jgi:hypothetical protein
MAAEKQRPKLKGSLDPGYQALLDAKMSEPPPEVILNDPAVKAALEVNAGIVELPIETGEEETEDIGPDPEGVTLKGSFTPDDPYAEDAAIVVDDTLGNGSTIPFKYRGRPTINFTTCKEPEPNKNRGCPMWYRCPVRDLGPGTIAFQDTKTKQIRADTCYNLLVSGIVANTRRYHFLPGVDFHVTYDVRWKPWPDGREVEVGPGKPKTELERVPVKNPLVMPFDADIVRQYEILRRRGEVR